MPQSIPAIVLALTGAVEQLGPLPPRPLAWREYPDRWTIVFEDGRKISFFKETAAPTPRKGKSK